MLFTSFEFLGLFLPIVFFVFEALGSTRQRIVWIILASLFFYSYWEARSLLLIVFSILLNLYIIHGILKYRRKAWAVAGVVGNLLPLLYFKYGGFILENCGIHLSPGQKAAMGMDTLPLAISFYTFVAIAYVVDAFKGKIENHKPLDYVFFVTFFPHLIAGPIVHHADLIPQIWQTWQIRQKPDRQILFLEGLLYFVLGFAKKMVLADPLGDIVDPLFAQARDHVLAWPQSVAAALGYTLQLYFDFSGYSDMAVGLGLFFGFRLPVNFLSPYKSVSITDFWRRWHITLSHFLRDYIYIPLGGNRRGKARQYANLLATMLIGGLWHGAGWNFVLWGGCTACSWPWSVCGRGWACPGRRLGSAGRGPLSWSGFYGCFSGPRPWPRPAMSTAACGRAFGARAVRGIWPGPKPGFCWPGWPARPARTPMKSWPGPRPGPWPAGCACLRPRAGPGPEWPWAWGFAWARCTCFTAA